MRAMIISFKQFLLQVWRDSMLVVICVVPIITGIFFKMGIPLAEEFLCEYFNKMTVLSGYYLIFDIFLALITPYMLCFSSAMIILEERDANITNYLSVTPIGIIIALIIISLSANKVEGMAFAKIGGIVLLGVAIPFLVTDTKQYLGGFLPSFWIAKSMLDFDIFNLSMSILVSAIWIGFLSNIFNKKTILS